MRIIIGIPTKNESATIANVTSVVDSGLSEYFSQHDCWIVNADNDSADDTRKIFLDTPTWSRKQSMNTGSVNAGKGTNVLAILEFAQTLEADVVCFIDGDVRSVSPEWIVTLVDESMGSSAPVFVTPQYVRNRYEANTTNQLVRPYLQAAFGLDISQPIGGEFGMNRAFVDLSLRWPRYDSTNLYGIDVWLTVNAALSGIEMKHVPMGRKIHNPTFPKIFRLGEQVLDTLFRLMMEQRPARPVFIDSTESDEFIDHEATRLPDELIQPILQKTRNYVNENTLDIVRTFPSLRNASWSDGLPVLDTTMWAQILADAYDLLTPATFRNVRNHVVGLFPARVASYWREIEHMDHTQVESLLRYQNNLVVSHFQHRPLPMLPLSTITEPELLTRGWEDAVVA
jgi:glycosyltransferase involved in cell wall biosynthesis